MVAAMMGLAACAPGPELTDTGPYSEPDDTGIPHVPPDSDWVQVEAVVVTGDQEGDKFGYSIDVSNEIGPLVVAGAPWNSVALSSPPAGIDFSDGAFILGPWTPAGVVTTVCDAAIVAPDEYHLGAADSVGFVGDVTGDGVGDVAVCFLDNDAEDDVSVAVMAGPVTGVRTMDQAAAWVGWDLANTPCYGLANDGDLGGDGAPDLVVGTNAGAGSEYVSVQVWFGPLSGAVPVASHDVLLTAVLGVGDPQNLHVADVDDDGQADLLIGADYAFDGPGGVFGILGPLDGDRRYDLDPDLRWAGDPARGSAHTGMAMAHGDLDGDGATDVFVGAPLADGSAGLGYVDLGGDGMELADAPIQIRPRHPLDWMGYGADFGDFDGDGQADLAVSATRNVYFGFDRPGRVLVFLGPLGPGSYGDDEADRVLIKAQTPDGFGYELRSLDLDEDGDDDLVVSAPGDPVAFSDGGSVSLLFDPLGLD